MIKNTKFVGFHDQDGIMSKIRCKNDDHDDHEELKMLDEILLIWSKNR